MNNRQVTQEQQQPKMITITTIATTKNCRPKRQSTNVTKHSLECQQTCQPNNRQTTKKGEKINSKDDNNNDDDNNSSGNFKMLNKN